MYVNVSRKQSFEVWTNLSQSLLVCGAAVHERLRYDWQAWVDDVRLVDIKHKLGIFDQVHPEA